jgi:hypothetical protein
MQAYSFHQDKDYENSRSAAQRYIDFFPAAEDAAYAQYILALSYYDQISEVGRDQDVTVKALQELRVLIERYPDSKYAKNAAEKFDMAFSFFGGKRDGDWPLLLAARILHLCGQSVSQSGARVSHNRTNSRGIISSDGMFPVIGSKG